MVITSPVHSNSQSQYGVGAGTAVLTPGGLIRHFCQPEVSVSPSGDVLERGGPVVDMCGRCCSQTSMDPGLYGRKTRTL